MAADNRELRARVEKAMTRADFEEHELSAYSSLDQWYGVEGINAPLGDPRFMPDDSLESLARTYRRHLEDERDGLGGSVPDLADREVEANLREIGREQGIRECLRHSWRAVDRMHPCGTDERFEFEDAGGLSMMAEAFRAGQEPMLRPTYKLAQFLDLQRWMRGLVTALVWPEKLRGDPWAMWAERAWREERSSYAALCQEASKERKGAR